jgi:hypothetical protein
VEKKVDLVIESSDAKLSPGDVAVLFFCFNPQKSKQEFPEQIIIKVFPSGFICEILIKDP